MLPAFVSGMSAIFQPMSLFLIIMGVAIGVTVGIMPGISGFTTLVILTPFVYGMNPEWALLFLISLHSVSYTGGSVTAVLVNIPGDSANAATLLDGFPMTQKGHAGRALGNALTASAVGGVFGAIVLGLVIPIAREVVMAFGAPESLLLVIMGISFIAVLGGRSVFKGLIAGMSGILLSLVGYAWITGELRWTFGSVYLYDGIRLVPLALGMFGVPSAVELITTGSPIARVRTEVGASRADLLQGIKDVFIHWWLTIRCSIIGVIVGIIPGIGGGTAAWVAYGHAKTTSKYPERFGTGYEAGVIAPESSNNAKEGGALIPTLSFGIPGSAGCAILLGIMVVLGVQPGPTFLKEHLVLVFTLTGALAVANVLAAVILLILATQLVKVALLPGHVIGPIILAFITVGAYCAENNMLDVLATFIFGGLGYVMTRLDYSCPALFLGYVLGILGERYFHLALAMYGWVFLTRPIVLTLLLITILSLTYARIAFPFRRRAREK